MTKRLFFCFLLLVVVFSFTSSIEVKSDDHHDLPKEERREVRDQRRKQRDQRRAENNQQTENQDKSDRDDRQDEQIDTLTF